MIDFERFISGILFRLGIVCISFVLSIDSWAAEPSQPSAPMSGADAEARAFVRELLLQQPPGDTQVRCQLKIRDADGRRRQVNVKYASVIGEQTWQGIYETIDPTPGEQLIVLHRGLSPNQYIYRTNMAERAKAVSPSVLEGPQAAIPFGGSDFWLSDLGMEFLHWPVQRLDRHAKITMRNGRPCKVVESINPAPNDKNYGKVVSWIDVEYGGLIFAQAYDEKGKLFKVFSLHGFKRINGSVQVKEMEIRNEKTDSRTRLEFLYDE